MIVSTKGRYALRVMIDMAENDSNKYIPLKEIANRQDISQKYLESIMVILSKSGMVDGKHGKNGGYKLNRPPHEYNLWEILQLTEKGLAPVACLEEGAEPCAKIQNCRTLPLWKDLNDLIKNFFESRTLADLANIQIPNDFNI